MKIPHILFRLINFVMVSLLRSPFHGVFSRSILAMRYTGKKSGRVLTVPARYISSAELAGGAQDARQWFLITSKDTKWWPNFVGAGQAQVLLAGQWVPASIEAITDNPNMAGPIMRALWAKHPSDASYMEVKMVAGEPDATDFERALTRAVVIRVTAT